MSGIALLLTGIGLAIAVLWSISNDDTPLRGRTNGWLAMRDDEAEERHEE